MERIVASNMHEGLPWPLGWIVRKLIGGYRMTTNVDGMEHPVFSALVPIRGGVMLAAHSRAMRDNAGADYAVILTPGNELWTVGWGPPWKFKIALTPNGDGWDRAIILGWIGAFRSLPCETVDAAVEKRARLCKMILAFNEHQGAEAIEFEWEDADEESTP